MASAVAFGPTMPVLAMVRNKQQQHERKAANARQRHAEEQQGRAGRDTQGRSQQLRARVAFQQSAVQLRCGDQPEGIDAEKEAKAVRRDAVELDEDKGRTRDIGEHRC